MVARLAQSPLDAHRGIDANDDRYEVDEFERTNWGASFGGPIVRDRTHFFLSYDQTARSQPFLRDIRGAGQYDAVRARYPDLLAGFSPNGDGTASGQFVRETDNLILFGKLNHRLNDDHSLTLRYNVTDYARTSDYVAEESRKLERTHALVGSVVSLLGETGVNEFRVQYAYDDLDRLANLPDSALQANFRIFAPSYGSFGKPWWLPITVDEAKFQLQERFSFLSGNHEIRLGVDFSRDDLSEYFAGNADGRYDFNDVDAFVNGEAARARIFFGDVSNPNFDVTQQTLGFYVQDNWSPSARLTLNVGARWDGTFNPDGIPHVLPEGTAIPDDLDNVSPRAGFVYSLDEGSILRGGAGIFYGRTPTLLFFSAYSDTGVFPRYGNAVVSPGQTGFVPLGAAIDNANPPAGLTRRSATSTRTSRTPAPPASTSATSARSPATSPPRSTWCTRGAICWPRTWTRTPPRRHATPTAARCTPASGSTRTTGRSWSGSRWRAPTTSRSPPRSGGASGTASSSRRTTPGRATARTTTTSAPPAASPSPTPRTRTTTGASPAGTSRTVSWRAVSSRSPSTSWRAAS